MLKISEFSKHSLTTEQNQNDNLEICKNSKKPIVIMPAGQQGINFYDYLQQHNINIEFFVDNNPKKHGTTLNGIKVISFDEFKTISDDKLLIIATNEQIEKLIINQLEENDVKNYKCIVADYLCYSADEIDNARNVIMSNFETYEKLYNMLADDLSKKTLINRLNYLITYNKNYLKEIMRPLSNQYFEPDIYNISGKDYFVDCGAFDGDTLEQLMTNVGSSIAGYYAFEPDCTNFEKLSEKSKKYSNITLIKKGVYKEDKILCFNNANNSSSQIITEGGIQIGVASIDSELKDKKVSFIKMDIEGAEYDAILGAKNLIQTQKPVLAISAYHKFNDVFELPFLIESFGVSYKYYLRHYTMQSAETVLYAVPKERVN